MIRKVENKSKVNGTTWWPKDLRTMIESTPKAHLKKLKQNGGSNYYFVIKCEKPDIARKLSALLRAINL